MDLTRLVTQQCERINEMYSVLVFSVSRIAASLDASLCVWKDLKAISPWKVLLLFRNRQLLFHLRKEEKNNSFLQK